MSRALRGDGGISEEEEDSSEAVHDNHAWEREVVPENGALYAG